jgi:hypothetical protein
LIHKFNICCVPLKREGGEGNDLPCVRCFMFICTNLCRSYSKWQSCHQSSGGLALAGEKRHAAEVLLRTLP